MSIKNNLVRIKSLHNNPEAYIDKKVIVAGWARFLRFSSNVGFIDLNDGTGFKGTQVVLNRDIEGFDNISRQNVGVALEVEGIVKLTPQAKQPFEIEATKVVVLGESTPEYPLQPKRHTMEFLRTKPHLRPRTNTFNAVFRIRSKAALAIHRFFDDNNFVYVNTPIITAGDCEGAGKMFSVTTLDLKSVPKDKQNTVDYSKDFFSKQVHLTVSGQLEGEAYALAFSDIYTFGPTFRAENSNTPRHAAEFWMIEPEISFANLNDCMDLAEKMLKYIVGYILDSCSDEIEFLNKFIDKSLLERLTNLVNSSFERVSYTQAIELLQSADIEFQYPVDWGCDLQTEHERYLTEKVFQKPLFITDYPKEIKAFYMRLNPDGKTVAACDLVVASIGELIGGSQREERLSELESRMLELGLAHEDYRSYLELRKYGSVKHAGFGLGFERLIMYLTGITNIRDVIPFPRTVGNIDT